jgi:hypothetical protein
MDTCRYCLKSITLNGMFWETACREIYCAASGGQHEPSRKDDDET